MDIIDETGTFYIDNFEYRFNGCDPGIYTVDKIYNTEGYCDLLFVNGGPNYQYYRKDHLGNNREVWNANGNVTYQRTQYYPSGLPWAESTNTWVQNKKYNGKEFVEAHGLDEYDSSARWYYPAIMRTTTLDPLAEKYYSISPYAWCGNNPVRIMDLNGMDWFYNDQTGAVAYISNLSKGHEKGMAEGWQWMGENEMFLKDHDDLLHTDDYLYGHYGGHDEYPFMINSQGKPEKVISHVLELDGKEAKEFMNDMGYDFKPTQQVRYDAEITYKQESGTEVKTGELTYITEKSGYVRKGSIENGFIPLNDARFKLPSSVNRFKIEYSTNIFVKGLNALMPFIGYHDMRIPTVYPSLSAYPWNNDLINKFLRRNPIPTRNEN